MAARRPDSRQRDDAPDEAAPASPVGPSAYAFALRAPSKAAARRDVSAMLAGGDPAAEAHAHALIDALANDDALEVAVAMSAAVCAAASGPGSFESKLSVSLKRTAEQQ